MHVVAVGMNHRTAPIEIRERLAAGPEAQRRLLASLTAHEAVQEGAILSTCNRLEVYAVLGRYHDGMEALVDLLVQCSGLGLSRLTPHLYVHHHHEVARHLFRVACGLDSMILGETEVLGQVREAFRLAQEAGAAGKVLGELFRRALHVGKRARSETGISQNAASVSTAAVELARRRLGRLEGRTAAVLGAGEVAGLAVGPLAAQGARLVFVNRTPQRAEELAARAGGVAVPWEERERAVAVADLAIVSTAAQQPVLTRSGLAAAREAAGAAGRPLVVIDLSVPRNVDPEVARLPGVRLYHIDDLQAVVDEGLRQREREVPRVEALVQEEVEAFSRWLDQLQVVPLIRSLRLRAEEVRRAELERLWARFPDVDPRLRQAVEVATAAIVKRILDEPTVRMKEAAARGEPYLRALRELFGQPLTGRRDTAARAAGG